VSHRARNGGKDTLRHWSLRARSFLLGPERISRGFVRRSARQERLRSRMRGPQRDRAPLIGAEIEG
jgi:hypothetical protein